MGIRGTTRGLWATIAAIAALGVIAPPASGAVTLGEPGEPPSGSGGQSCGANRTWFQLEGATATYEAPHDGVLTSWTVGDDWSPNLKLKIGRPAGGDALTIVAEDGPRAAPDGGASFNVRIPIRQGDSIGLRVPENFDCFTGGPPTEAGDVIGYVTGDPAVGTNESPAQLATGRRVGVSAVLERDTDGDGFGDETQDACPTNASTHDACPLPTQLGQTMDPHYPTCMGGLVFPLTTPGLVSAVQRDGVITSWSYQSLPGFAGATVQLVILKPLGGNSYLVKAESEVQPVAPDALNTYPTRIPVQLGDRIAIRSEGTPTCGITAPAWQAGGATQELAVGSSGTFSTSNGLEVDLSAIEEADADGDGYGDTSQDLCPTDASTQGQCPTGQPPDDQACDKARAKLEKAKAKLRKLKRKDAAPKQVKKAKAKVKKAKAAVKKAC